MKYFFSFFLFITFFSSKAQEIVGYTITNKDEKINFYKNLQEKSKLAYNHVIAGDISFTGEYLYYVDKNNEFQRIAQKKIKELSHDSIRYLTLPINWSSKRVHEVIAENNSYLLTQYYFSGFYYFYVFDKSDMKYVENKIPHSYSKRKDQENFKRYIKPYFSDCPQLLDKISYNINNIVYEGYIGNRAVKEVENYLFRTISDFKCE